MAVLKDKDKKKVATALKDITDAVTIVMFTQEFECPHCEMTRTLLEEVSSLSDKITLEVYDFVADEERATQHGIDKIPATVLVGEKDYGIRFYGVPAGYEFNVLVQDIVDVGKRDPNLPDTVRSELAAIDQPVHLQTIISPT